MREKMITLIGMIVILFILSTYAAHAVQVVTGYVANRDDGRAQGRTVVIWKSGTDIKSDNKTAVVSSSNIYAINCGSPGGFITPCVNGDNISARVVFNGTFSSKTEWVIINTGDGSPATDVRNLSLAIARPPKITFLYPVNNTVGLIGNDTINTTIQNNSIYEVDKAIYLFKNSSGNYSEYGTAGSSNLYPTGTSPPVSGRYNWTDIYNASLLNNGTYTLCVRTNNSLRQFNVSCIRVFITNLSVDLAVYDTELSYTPSAVIEFLNTTINATVRNLGKSSINATIQFWWASHKNRNYTNGTLIRSIDLIVQGRTNQSVVFNWTAQYFGMNSLYVVADPPIATSGSIPENDENNNVGYINITLPIWHTFAGNVSGSLVLSDLANYSLLTWNVTNSSSQNIYFTSAGQSISFADLRALGRNTSGNYEYKHFLSIDTNLNVSHVNDSINLSYTASGQPKATTSLYVFGTEITNVPVINSTNSSSFLTGILWDTSDDDGDGGYDTTDKEDIVFVTTTSENIPGMYGTYDFEVRVPAPLRDYTSWGADDPVAIFVELQ